MASVLRPLHSLTTSSFLHRTRRDLIKMKYRHYYCTHIRVDIRPAQSLSLCCRDVFVIISSLPRAIKSARNNWIIRNPLVGYTVVATTFTAVQYNIVIKFNYIVKIKCTTTIKYNILSRALRTCALFSRANTIVAVNRLSMSLYVYVYIILYYIIWMVHNIRVKGNRLKSVLFKKLKDNFRTK